MDDDDWRYNYFLITIDVQVNPYQGHRTDRVTVEFRLDEIEPGYCDAIRYQPTTSPGTMSHSIGIGFILGIGGIGVSSGYTQSVTQPMIRVEDDSAIVPGKEDQRILWTTEYSYPRVQPSEHSHWTRYSILLKCHNWEFTQEGKLKVYVTMDGETDKFEYRIKLQHFH